MTDLPTLVRAYLWSLDHGTRLQQATLERSLRAATSNIPAPTTRPMRPQ